MRKEQAVSFTCALNLTMLVYFKIQLTKVLFRAVSQLAPPPHISFLMAHAPPLSQTLPSQSNPKQEEEGDQSIRQHITNLVSTLPAVDVGIPVGKFCRHRDGWYAPPATMAGAMAAQQHFKARPTDVILAALPKSGTTWLKALLFATVHRRRLPAADLNPDLLHPLAALSPHECIRFLESGLYMGGRIPDTDPDPDPRLFSTHIPFQSLPESVVGAGCRIVYLCRDPKDNFVSSWHFMNKFRARGEEPIEVALDQFCSGVSLFGPCWDHMLGYWKAHLERPDEVLFLKYEELKADPVDQLRRVAEFVGCPFAPQEEEGGVAEGIVRLCAMENLSNLEVNKSGSMAFGNSAVENSFFFRRGVVGDWKNYLAPEMAQRLDEITHRRFKGSGLTF